MSKTSDISIKAATLYFLPITLRTPLKFGAGVLTSVTCARVALRVEGKDGRSAVGWGETPLSVQWVWPSACPYEERHAALMDFSRHLADKWTKLAVSGHPFEIAHAFIDDTLPKVLETFNAARSGEAMPWLAALVCASAFDIALHDAYGVLHAVPVYATYNAAYMNQDLAAYLEAAPGAQAAFDGRYPEDYLVRTPPSRLPAWHLVGGVDRIDLSECDGGEPEDGYPVLLRDWIARDGLDCLKIKLRGNDASWDYDRIVKVGEIALDTGAHWLSTDFNCTVHDPAYVNEILDRLLWKAPDLFAHILYVEQPFPYDLEAHPIDVHSVSARKPLFMDESAHDWRHVARGRELGWSGVALKTCKTQTGALLSLCWAKAHGMTLMVQDLTNPMLAQIPHVLLAAYAGTIMGVETNAMQFYPEASLPEAAVHPGLYQRRAGYVDLSTLAGPGFGYRVDEIARELPEPAAAYG